MGLTPWVFLLLDLKPLQSKLLIYLRIISPVYTGSQTGSGLESGLRPRNGGGPGDPNRDLNRLHSHGAESRIGSRKVVSCKRGYRSLSKTSPLIALIQQAPPSLLSPSLPPPSLPPLSLPSLLFLPLSLSPSLPLSLPSSLPPFSPSLPYPPTPLLAKPTLQHPLYNKHG